MAVKGRNCVSCLWQHSSACWTNFDSVIWTASIESHCQLVWSPATFFSWLGKILHVFRMALMWSLYHLYWSLTAILPDSNSMLKAHCKSHVCSWHGQHDIAANQKIFSLIVNNSEFQHVVPYPANVTWEYFVSKICRIVQEFANGNKTNCDSFYLLSLL